MIAKRNGYIDVIKLLLAIIVAEFHLGSGLFPGGRLAVDGFFMITGYLMMRSIESDKGQDRIGVSTVKFLYRKYKALLPILIVFAIIGFSVHCVIRNFSFGEAMENLPLLIFDIFPMQATGMKGVYVLGISWYLSSMFIALAVLYPFIKKFGQGFSLVACPLIALVFYGILSAKYGHIAVGAMFLENSIIHTGWLRAIAGCSMGCLIYEITKRARGVEFTRLARVIFTIAESALLVFILYMMHYYPKGIHNYVVVFAIFGMLIIGIGGFSYTSKLWNPKWTKYMGLASTLLVLNHYCWAKLLLYKLSHLGKTETILAFIGLSALACIVTHLVSQLLVFLMGKIFKKKYFVKQ